MGERYAASRYTCQRNDSVQARPRDVVRICRASDSFIGIHRETSRLAADVSQNEVRRAGLEAGLVDYKVCAVDEDWSALRFTKRKPPSKRR